jgi:hypothetical protein
VPCFLGCLAIAFPRIALFLIWLFDGQYLLHAYRSRLLPLIGFLFLPLTTITFAFAVNALSSGGVVMPVGWLLTALALLADLGLLGGGRRQWQRYRE